MVIGKRIKRKREELGLTQNQVAQSIHISRAAYSQYETGGSSITAETLWDLAQALAVPVGYFYAEKDFDFDVLEVDVLFGRLPIICKQTIRAFILHMLTNKKVALRLVKMLDWGDRTNFDEILDDVYDEKGRAIPGGPIPIQLFRVGVDKASEDD